MKIVITDLTRIYDGHICVAGIEVESLRRVRPVSGRLPSRLLRRNGGPFDVRAIVDLGPTRSTAGPPEVEDVDFNPSRCVDLGDMPPREFLELCQESASDDLDPIGPELRKYGRSLTTKVGRGNCSLVLVHWKTRPHIFINGFDKLRFKYSTT